MDNTTYQIYQEEAVWILDKTFMVMAVPVKMFIIYFKKLPFIWVYSHLTFYQTNCTITIQFLYSLAFLMKLSLNSYVSMSVRLSRVINLLLLQIQIWIILSKQLSNRMKLLSNITDFWDVLACRWFLMFQKNLLLPLQLIHTIM